MKVWYMEPLYRSVPVCVISLILNILRKICSSVTSGILHGPCVTVYSKRSSKWQTGKSSCILQSLCSCRDGIPGPWGCISVDAGFPTSLCIFQLQGWKRYRMGEREANQGKAWSLWDWIASAVIILCYGPNIVCSTPSVFGCATFYIHAG